MNVAVIGVGRMGAPMLSRLLSAGHQVTVLERRSNAAASPTLAGVTRAQTLCAAVQAADVVVVVVRTDEQVQSVCLGPNGALAHMKPQATLVQHTTSNPATVEQIAREGAARGIRALDAALSGGPHDVAAGTLTLWVGGEEADLEAVRPVLASYAAPIVFVGAIGDGQRVKLVNNALFVAQVGLTIDAVRLASSLGIAEQTILSALQHGSAASRALSVVARAGTVSNVAPRLADLMRKDIEVVRDVVQRSAADLGIIGKVLASDAVQHSVLATIAQPELTKR